MKVFVYSGCKQAFTTVYKTTDNEGALAIHCYPDNLTTSIANQYQDLFLNCINTMIHIKKIGHFTCLKAVSKLNHLISKILTKL